MNDSARSILCLVLFWLSALAVSAVYFGALNRIAPEILSREGRVNHGDLYALAERNYRQVRELRWALPASEKIRLLDQAVQALEKAAQQRPESRDYQWFLGQTLYLRAYQEDPPNPELVKRAVEIVSQTWDSTGREWEKPGSFLAEYYLQSNQPELAAPVLERLLSVHPDSPDLYTMLLNALLAQHQNDEALALLRRKRERLSLSASDLDLLTNLNLKKGDYHAAIDALKLLFAGGAADSRHRLLLVGALRVVGEYEEAFRVLRDFIEALGSGSRLRPVDSYGLTRYPQGLFPPLSYLLLEGRLGSIQ